VPWWAAALAGAAPDLLWFVPAKVEQVARRGWAGLLIGREPGIWKADGPPLPADLVIAYERYYVYTHSLAVLGVACALAWWLGRRRWLWLAVPYALHIAMDVPTHERFIPQPFFPFSSWQCQGLTWTDPRIFWPNVAGLAVVYGWVWHRGREAGERMRERETQW
jgi:hypothetical protein